VSRTPAAEGAAKFFHQPKVLNLVADFEKRFGFTRSGMTSWVGNSITGYLTTDQIAKLREDKAVHLISDNELGEFSAPPPYYDFSPGTFTASWGSMAVIPHTKLSGSTRKVYVIDGGVAQHSNLPSVVARKNVACGASSPAFAASGDCVYTSTSVANYPVVGCYGHATHVAGIIAGQANTGATYGVYAGVNLVSVNVSESGGNFQYGAGSPLGNGSSSVVGWCATSVPSPVTLGYALDYVYWDTAYNNNGKLAVANISMNPGKMGWTLYAPTGTYISEQNYLAVRKLATPGAFQTSSGQWASYQGVFVAQSAGNYGLNACGTDGQSYAYKPPVGYFPGGPPPAWSTDPYDGIMVVGAINSSGQAVTSFTDSYPSGIRDTAGSNYGPCVDIWAPGNRIVSTWGNHAFWQRGVSTAQPDTRVGTLYSGTVGSGTSGWMYLSGTSMAAPHVAGVAAYLADAHGLTSPAAVEQKIRLLSQQYNGAVDAAGWPVRTLQSQ
jgi:subtilisin family serine protease